MNNQFSRNGYKTKKKSGSPKQPNLNWYRLAILLLGLAVVTGGSIVGYQYHKYPKRFPALVAFSERVNIWWVERKARIETKMTKVALVKPKSKHKSSAPEPVHFEFYTMLPNVGAAVPVAEAKPEPVKSIFDQDSLEREFTQEMSKSAYIIQTGMFSNAASAEKMSQTLTEDGLAPKIVKAYLDEHLVYRVQLGPYDEKNKISDAQSKLAARGIHGTLRKVGERFA